MEAPPQKNAIDGLYSVRAILVAKEINFCAILTVARSSCIMLYEYSVAEVEGRELEVYRSGNVMSEPGQI